jgi:2-dehydropantoate 2-reductase
LVLITLKTTANGMYEKLISPLVREGTAILTLQNGLGNEGQLAALFGAERVLGGMAFVCINRLGPGVIHHMDHGVIKIGEYQGGDSERARRIAQWFNESRIVCQVLEDLDYGRWEKLVWNIPFNGLGALLDLTTDKLIDSEGGRELVRSLMQEVVDAFQASGVAFRENIIEEKIKNTQTMGAYRTSMQIDRQNGQEMEVGAILGEPLRMAERVGISTPYLRMLYAQLSLINKAGILK